jgi:hypothetical protein
MPHLLVEAEILLGTSAPSPPTYQPKFELATSLRRHQVKASILATLLQLLTAGIGPSRTSRNVRFCAALGTKLTLREVRFHVGFQG